MLLSRLVVQQLLCIRWALGYIQDIKLRSNFLRVYRLREDSQFENCPPQLEILPSRHCRYGISALYQFVSQVRLGALAG